MSDTPSIFDGFGDHHHITAKGDRIDKNHQADRAVKDLAWDLLNGKTTAEAEAAKREGPTVSVPMEYVGAVAYFALKELKRRGCNSAFSVARSGEQPTVQIRWDRPGAELIPEGMGPARAHEQVTDCLRAYVDGRDPQHVGTEAADLFVRKLAEAEGW